MRVRKLFLPGVSLLALTLSFVPAFAGSAPALTSAPSNLTCSFTTVSVANDAVQCSWDPLVGATKYSVDAIANYELGNALGNASSDFDFGTSLSTVLIPLSSFPTDVNGDTVSDNLLSLVLRVKGLAPPGKTVSNQNNPFSTTVTCSIGTVTCVTP